MAYVHSEVGHSKIAGDDEQEREPRGSNHHLVENGKGGGITKRDPKTRNARTPSRSRRFCKFVVYAAIGLFAAVQLVILGLQIFNMRTKTTGYEEAGPDFPLYKNTRFRSCAAGGATAQVNCTDILNRLFDIRTTEDIPIFEAPRFRTMLYMQSDIDSWNPARDLGKTYGEYWCEAVGCLGDFKVIPSTPKASAFHLSTLSYWSAVNIITLTAFVFARKSFFVQKHRVGTCKYSTRDIIDFLLTFWTLASFGFWVSSLATYLKNPGDSGPMTFLQWISMWKLARQVSIHPISCALHGHRRLQMALTVLLCVIAFAQASMSLPLYMTGPDAGRDFRTYECLEDAVTGSPGVSQCLSRDLCGSSQLFEHRKGIRGLTTIQGDGWWGSYLFQFILFLWMAHTIADFASLSLWLLDRYKTQKRAGDRLCLRRKKIAFYRAKYLMPDAVLLVFAVVAVVMGAMATIARWGAENREAFFVVDMDCHAVHVHMSPWKQYLDIETGRALRVAKSWFNA